MHRVKFFVKNVEVNDPEYRLLSTRSMDFRNFTNAMEFVRQIKARLTSREVLIGTPEIEVA